MPSSVYKLIFRDPNLKKLAPNKMQIGTYTNDPVKIVGTCKLYLVHSDTKTLKETTFYVATNDGSMLLSCISTLDLDLIQPRYRLDYLPPRASLITSTQDHPKKPGKLTYIYIDDNRWPPKANIKWKQTKTSNNIAAS